MSTFLLGDTQERNCWFNRDAVSPAWGGIVKGVRRVAVPISPSRSCPWETQFSVSSPPPGLSLFIVPILVGIQWDLVVSICIFCRPMILSTITYIYRWFTCHCAKCLFKSLTCFSTLSYWFLRVLCIHFWKYLLPYFGLPFYSLNGKQFQGWLIQQLTTVDFSVDLLTFPPWYQDGCPSANQHILW